ncbi:hypothetical protein BC936DRAFT_142962 [Jimgerdemannia flammicorona]|uniref:L-ornithine N(5)-monooxygenase n=1 Tax=Jimgerdemannia flammicorona TaxID=994334 RepID=A0A433DEJ6_9FUNG|nr:hypothetical protein BC936DRAFT_142962 [Jimgerdemannia flammicorona]
MFHPNTDADPGQLSRFSWRSEPWKGYSHAVLGKGEIGGAWAEMKNSDERTVSYAENMDLPKFTYADWWSATHITTPSDRPFRSDVAHYYQDYVHAVGIADAFHPHTEVTHVITMEEALAAGWCACGDVKDGKQCEMCAKFGYVVCGYVTQGGKAARVPFSMRAKAVVLATGIFERPKWLGGVVGEDADFVSHELKDIVSYNPACDDVTNSRQDSLVPSTANWTYPTPPASPRLSLSAASDPYLIVGSGLSAADAIIHLRAQGVPVLHIFHHPTSRNPHYSTSPLAACSRSVYPEYAALYRRMKRYATGMSRAKEDDSGYEGLVNARVVELKRAKDGRKMVTMQDEEGRVFSQAVGGVGILIGRKIDMGFLKGQAQEQILASREETNEEENNDVRMAELVHNSTISPSSRRLSLDFTISSPLRKVDPYSFRAVRPVKQRKEPRLYAIGALTGDTFVRFVLGGGLGVLWDLERWLGKSRKSRTRVVAE